MTRSTRTTRTTRRTVAGAFAVALALGFASPAMAAGPNTHAKPSHVSSHGSRSTAGVLKQIDRTDARLAAAGRDSRIGALPDDAKATITTNILADRAALAELRTAVEGGGDAAAARDAVRAYRPENYTVVVNFLRQAAELGTLLGEAEVPDASAALAEVGVQAALVTAQSDKSELEAVKDALSAARDLVEDYLDALEDTTEGDSTEDDSTEDDSTEGDDTVDDTVVETVEPPASDPVA